MPSDVAAFDRLFEKLPSRHRRVWADAYAVNQHRGDDDAECRAKAWQAIGISFALDEHGVPVPLAAFTPVLARRDFDPDEPRDEHGMWTAEGGAGPPSSPGSSRPPATPEDWTKATPHANPAVFAAANDYLAHAGLPPLRALSQQSLAPDEGRAIADSYDHAPNDPKDPAVRAAYKAFNAELGVQRLAAERAGYRFEAWDKPGQPYANSKEMVKDVADNHHLYYFKSTEGTTPNELMSLEQNDTFRAVHDLFGHAMAGNQFGPKGETNAFLDHVQMFSPLARQALATETIGQNAWFNFSRANEGKPVTERKFADQKAFLLDPKLYQPLIDRAARKDHMDAVDVDENDYYFACPCHRRAKKASSASSGDLVE